MQYTSFNDYCRARFGCKVYKLSLDAGFTCPNRDGTLATGGCTFCAGGSGGRFCAGGSDIKAQLAAAKELVKAKGAHEYIAYFQAYSGTYAPVSRLEALYRSAAESEDIVALAIATRPDCLSREVLALLERLNRQKPVIVELGLQTANEQTAHAFHRCYPNSTYLAAVKALKGAGIHTVTHLIFGLPGESEADMLASVEFACAAGTDGVKFHMLNILEGSALAEIFRREPFELMSREAYASLVAKAVALLPPGVVVHRLTGDGDKRLLIAPEWVKDKKKTLNLIHKEIEKV
ncbi:MAG: TIGR01212 family radical SAM protein [Clostridia bacterium]|nr:TIGR01212 family radical SAM protein [Clostridia bacterium]